MNQVQIDWLLAVAFTYTQNAKYQDAIHILEFVLSHYNRNLDAVRGLSFCYLESQRYHDCIKACQRFLLLIQDNPIDRQMHARVYLILAQANQALHRHDAAHRAMLGYRTIAAPIVE